MFFICDGQIFSSYNFIFQQNVMLGSLIHTIFYQPIFNLLMLSYTWTGSLGLAIIIIAGLSKIVTIPLTRKQLKSSEQLVEFQKLQEQIRKKYKKNKEKLNEELAKLGAKFLPVQLGGCLPMIITIVLLLQIRSVVINLVDRGFHAFNEVAYSQSLRKPEDAITLLTETNLPAGEHIITVEASASNGTKLSKDYIFEITDNIELRLSEITQELKAVSSEDRIKQREALNEKSLLQRETDIAVFSPVFDDPKSGNLYSITLSRNFLYLPSDVEKIILLSSLPNNTSFYIRAPSGETITETKLSIDGQEVAPEALAVTKGETLNLEFLGMNLSKVGMEFADDWKKFTPYLILAVLLAVTQFATMKVQMGFQLKQPIAKEDTKMKQKQKKKIEEPEELDFRAIMERSNKNMIYFMPVLTALISLGLLGGASGGWHLFPSGVSIFWTAQSLFVIIQLAIAKKDILKEMYKNKFLSASAKK